RNHKADQHEGIVLPFHHEMILSRAKLQVFRLSPRDSCFGAYASLRSLVDDKHAVPATVLPCRRGVEMRRGPQGARHEYLKHSGIWKREPDERGSRLMACQNIGHGTACTGKNLHQRIPGPV